MLIKKLSHLHKARRNRSGGAFAVLGYPRSGTTMLSEIVAMVTDYYFDRDNIFPSSSKVVLHTHWSPVKFAPAHSVYVMRHPIDVCLSVMEYSKVRGFPQPAEAALSAPEVCKIPWIDHVEEAVSRGHHIVVYERLVAGDDAEFALLAAHLNVPMEWLRHASALLNAKHASQPHASDTRFQLEKSKRKGSEISQMRAQLGIGYTRELGVYEKVARHA